MKSSVELVSHMPGEVRPILGIEYAIANSARTCSGSSGTPEKDVSLIRYLWKNKHMTPFEAVVFSFIIKCPKFVANHIVRHRTLSINEKSYRYTTAQKEDFFQFDRYRKQDKTFRQRGGDNTVDPDPDYLLFASGESQYPVYEKALESGMSREQARCVLPFTLMTTLYVTVNLRNLMHFLELRTSPDAQEETRFVAEQMLSIIRPLAPVTCELFMDSTKVMIFDSDEMNVINGSGPVSSLGRSGSKKFKDKIKIMAEYLRVIEVDLVDGPL